MRICYVCNIKYKGDHIMYCKIATIRYLIEDGFTFYDIRRLFPIDKKLQDKINLLYKNRVVITGIVKKNE